MWPGVSYSNILIKYNENVNEITNTRRDLFVFYFTLFDRIFFFFFLNRYFFSPVRFLFPFSRDHVFRFNRLSIDLRPYIIVIVLVGT